MHIYIIYIIYIKYNIYYDDISGIHPMLLCRHILRVTGDLNKEQQPADGKETLNCQLKITFTGCGFIYGHCWSTGRKITIGISREVRFSYPA